MATMTMTEAGAGALVPDVIHLGLDVRDRKEALEAVAALVARSRGLAAAPVFRALWRREEAGSTALGRGVAIPHARIDTIARPVKLLVHTKYPIEFDAPDRVPVSLLYVILVPADGSTDEHLQLLALVAQAMSEPALRVGLVTAISAPAVADLFARWVDRLDGTNREALQGLS
jgi:PTS system nitrogen regulatory IIA component